MADTVPAMLEPGEFIIRRDAARRIGQPALNALNNFDRAGGAHGAIDELIALGGLGMQAGGFASSPYGSFHELVQARGSAEEGSEEYQLLQDQINALYQQGGGTYEGAAEAFGTPAQPNVPAQSDPTQNLTQQPTSLNSLTQQFAPQEQMPQASDVGKAYDPSTWTERSPLGKSLMSTFSGDQSYEPSLGDQLTQRAGLYGRSGYQGGGAVGTDSPKFVGPLSLDQMMKDRPELGLRRDYKYTPEEREAFDKQWGRREKVRDEADLFRSMRSDPDFADVKVPDISNLLRLQEGYTKGRTAVDDTESAFMSSLGRAKELEDLNWERHLDVVGEEAASSKRKELLSPRDVKWGEGSPYPAANLRGGLESAELKLGIRDRDTSYNPMGRAGGARTTEDAGWTRQASPKFEDFIRAPGTGVQIQGKPWGERTDLSPAEYISQTTPGVETEDIENIQSLQEEQRKREDELQRFDEEYGRVSEDVGIENAIAEAQQAFGTDWQDPMAQAEKPEELVSGTDDMSSWLSQQGEIRGLGEEGQRKLREKYFLESGYSQEQLDEFNMYRKRQGYQQGGMVGETRREYAPGTSLGVVDEDRNLMSQLKNMQGDISLLQLQKDMHYPNPKMFNKYRSLKESMGDIMTQEEMMGVLNKAAKKTQGMFKPEGYQEGGDVRDARSVYSESQEWPSNLVQAIYEMDEPSGKGKRYYFGEGRAPYSRSGLNLEDALELSMSNALSRQSESPQDSIQVSDVLNILQDPEYKGSKMSLEGYQDGGNVYSYGGASSTVPTLEDIWESTGIKPNQANIGRFEEYDVSREKTRIDDYWSNLESMRKSGGAKVGAARKQAQTVGKGFSGMGQREAGVQDTLSSMMEAQKAGGEQEYRGLFEDIRGMREDYLTEQTSNLYDVEGAEGTQRYGMGEQYRVPTDDPSWSPPGSPTSGQTYAFNNDTYYWNQDTNSWETEEDFNMADAQSDIDYG